MDQESPFGQWLQQRRKALDLTQSELAQRVGCAPTTLAAIEAGRRRPSRQLAARLADQLDLDADNRAVFLQYARDSTAHPTPPSNRTITDAGPATLPEIPLRHQLRPPLADFVGRTQETDRVVHALQMAAVRRQGAIISGVHGMGGIGKTELAYWVAHQLCDSFPGGQIVLDLHGSHAAPLSREQVLQQVIQAFTPDAKLPDDLPTLERHYRTLLHNQQVLILADDALNAVQVQSLVPPVGSALLITSRQRFTLPGMTTVHLEQLGETEAIVLLRRICDRLHVDEARAIARACEYLPLALRVSGGILSNDPALDVSAYIARLTDARQRLAQLCDPDNGQLDVAASLMLSYTTLEATSQAVFRQLGVLEVNFAAELALAVVEAPAAVNVIATLHRLLRRNLIMYNVQRDRWWLHDLVRDIARRLLEEAGETEATMWRYARAAVQIAQETQDQYRVGGSSVLTALARFDTERPHIDVARSWALAHVGTPAGDALLLAAACATRDIGALRYDTRHERIPYLECACAAAQRVGDRRGENLVLNEIGIACWELGDLRRAITCFEQQLSIAGAINDRHGEEVALGNLGLAYDGLGDSQKAIEYYEQGLAVAQEIGDRHGEGNTLLNLGIAYAEMEKDQEAIRCYEQALSILQEVGDRWAEGVTLSNMARTYAALGKYQQAIECGKRGLAFAQELGGRRQEGYACYSLARSYATLGDLAAAVSLFEQALDIFHVVGDRAGAATCNWHFGLFLACRGDRARAIACMRVSVAYEQEIGHMKAAEHASLLACLDAGEDLPAELLRMDVLRPAPSP